MMVKLMRWVDWSCHLGLLRRAAAAINVIAFFLFGRTLERHPNRRRPRWVSSPWLSCFFPQKEVPDDISPFRLP